MKFSANLGCLWNDLPLAEAIRSAANYGFDAVECHWPYETPSYEVFSALKDTNLKMLGINTRQGSEYGKGLSAIPGREDEAISAIDEAIDYAVEIGAKSVHVMSGVTSDPEASKVLINNLRYACRRAESYNIEILIEPLNPYDAPGYFLKSPWQAVDIINQVGEPGLKLMFDCYHHQIICGDICRSFERLLPYVGHVQIASVPSRTSPDSGEVDYEYVLSRFGELGWRRPIGVEYVTGGDTESTLDWLPKFKKFFVS